MQHLTRTHVGLFAGAISVIVATNVSACSPGSVDLSNKGCPCASGWTCEPSTNRCIPNVIPNAEVLDATTDSAPSTDAADAGASDADVDASTDARGPLDEFECPPPYGGATSVIDDAGPIPDGGKNCRVHSDGILRCTNDSTVLFAAPAFGSPRVDDLWSLYTGFVCFEYGDKHPNGNATWYLTCGNLNKTKGYVSAKLLHTHSTFDADPSKHGLRRCSPPPLDAGQDAPGTLNDGSTD